MKNLLTILMVLTALTACKKGEPNDGGVLIALKNNQPCFYLYDEKDNNQKADNYHLLLENSEPSVDDEKEGQRISFTGDLPMLKSPESCFMFSDFSYRLNDIYVVSSSKYSASTYFCLVENNGKLQINQAEYVRDSQGWSTQVCSDKAYSNHRGIWWQFKRWLF
ncbi:NF045616 family extracytoplasmic (lipo)protein [Moraxella porci]|uniref:NF045616 family extracytoplasmic (lipo)protein n=1 Tax=Moraxella porci TaxID=1288392 RepID=UPI002449F6C1|nr:NF045616 family extracytoplasmic (lipo)protein [Moraxella porci]MDH2274428.1 hypothetical protein [Moraxella porci]